MLDSERVLRTFSLPPGRFICPVGDEALHERETGVGMLMHYVVT